MPTIAEVVGVEPPAGGDGISFAPTLLGQPEKQKQHDYLYWEFYEGAGARALRQGRWKAVRAQWSAPIELYDVEDADSTFHVPKKSTRTNEEIQAEVFSVLANWIARKLV